MRERLEIDVQEYMTGPVSGCSLEAQGLWLRMSLLMCLSDRPGYLSNNGSEYPLASICRRCGCDLEQYGVLAEELVRAGVLLKDPHGVIYNKSIVEAQRLRTLKSRAGKASASKRKQFLFEQNSNRDSTGPPTQAQGPPQHPVETQTRDIDLKTLETKPCKSKSVKPKSTAKSKALDVKCLELYNAYPRKKKRPQALRAIRKALSKISFEKLMEAVKKFAKEREGKDPDFTPYPATWFNGDSWDDEPDPLFRPQGNSKKVQATTAEGWDEFNEKLRREGRLVDDSLCRSED
jgi:hypothetical protein